MGFFIAFRSYQLESRLKKNNVRGSSPIDLLKALGVEIIEENKERFIVAFQGGYFDFNFSESENGWVDILYFDFKQIESNYLSIVAKVSNTIHLRFWGWTCFVRMLGDETTEKSLSACLSCRFTTLGDIEVVSKKLRGVLEQAFLIAREFNNLLEEDIKKKKDLDEEFFNDVAFNNKIAYLQRLKETHHLEERGDEFPNSSELSVDNLIKLFDHVDFGNLQNLRIVREDQIEIVTNVEEIKNFDLRKYIRLQQEVLNIRTLTFIFDFDFQDLFVNLTKAKGSTENSLFFGVNVVRSGSELDALMDNRGPISSRTMMEIRMADSEKDYWEAKYMIDEANDKVNAGNSDELTDEQRLVLSYTNPVSQLALYWGKKYYNNRCYFQSLFYFNQIYWHLKNLKQEWNEEQSRLYYDVCYYIGFIYVDLNMYDKAFYYLYMAQTQHSIGATQEFANCLCNMNDPSAKQYLQSKINEVVEIMNKSEEEAERLYDFYLFLKRRYVYILIEQGGYDEAESILKKMIENEECVEFAKDELDYIKKQRGEMPKNEQTEKPKNLYL